MEETTPISQAKTMRQGNWLRCNSQKSGGESESHGEFPPIYSLGIQSLPDMYVGMTLTEHMQASEWFFLQVLSPSPFSAGLWDSYSSPRYFLRGPERLSELSRTAQLIWTLLSMDLSNLVLAKVGTTENRGADRRQVRVQTAAHVRGTYPITSPDFCFCVGKIKI